MVYIYICTYEYIYLRAGDSGRVTLKLKDQLTYTSAVVHEAMRVKTVAPIGIPHMTTRDTSLRKAGTHPLYRRLLYFCWHGVGVSYMHSCCHHMYGYMHVRFR